MHNFKLSRTAWLILAGLAGLIFIGLLFRNMGLYPSVFADEYLYSKFARLVPLHESTIPGYVYLWLYGITNYCGDGFLECAKLLNTLLFVSATPFIFLTARKVASTGLSLLVTALALIGPVNLYTAFFMPESFYFLSFWIFCWYFLSLNVDSPKSGWLIAGVLYGLSSLVKPHSILFLPAILLYIGTIFIHHRKLSSGAIFKALTLFLIGGVLAKFGLGYLFAGSAGLTFFGPLYGKIASSTASRLDEFIGLLQLAHLSFNGHFLVLASLYGLPLVLTVTLVLEGLWSRFVSKRPQAMTTTELQRTTLFTLLVLANLFFAVAFFTASVTQDGPYESPYRLHMRYYNFALPLLFIVAAGVFSARRESQSYLRYWIGMIFAAIGVYAVWTNLGPYTPGLIDSPEMRGLQLHGIYFKVCAALLIASLITWMFLQRRGLQTYLYIALPLYVCVSTFYVSYELRGRLQADTYDVAGVFAKNYLPDEHISKVLIVGAEEAKLFRTLFHLDNPLASIEVIERGEPYDIKNTANEFQWVLLIGDHELADTPSYQIQLNGFSLNRVSEDNLIDFRMGVWPGVISSSMGLSTPEDWGTWSQSDVVMFEFLEPLPEAFELLMTARAFGPNIGSEFEVSVGPSTSKFTLSTSLESRTIRLENPTKSNILSIKIPMPVSPKALGMGGDTRDLGIGLARMRIVPLD